MNLPDDGAWLTEIPAQDPRLLVFDGEEWSALYVDGVLDTASETYLIDERIRILAGVITVQTGDFFCGGHRRDDVAPTIEDVRAYRRQRLYRQQEADRLRAQAAELMRTAEEIEKS